MHAVGWTLLCCLLLTLPAYDAHLRNNSGAQAAEGTADTMPIMQLLNGEGYDPKIPPSFNTDTSTIVTVQLYVLSVDRVNENAMDFSMTIYLRQSWVDPRLRFTTHFIQDIQEELNLTQTAPNHVEEGQTTVGMAHHHTADTAGQPYKQNGTIYTHTEDRLELDSRAKSKVWMPDTYFANERKAYLHDVTAPNELLHIFPNGTVFSSMRISLTLTCHMRLEKYPFDKQDCPVVISSYGYTSHTVSYIWDHRRSVVVKPGVELPTFKLTNWKTLECAESEASIGNFSCIQAEVTLERSYGYYVVQVYLPSCLLVVLSWVNFWLDISATPARVSLGLLAVLTMTTMGVGAKSNLPPVSYVKAIDIWFSVCLVFVFGALIEFAFVNVTSRVQNRRLTMSDAVKLAIDKNRATKMGLLNKSPNATTPTQSGATSPESPTSVLGKRLSKTRSLSQRERARVVDKISRILFPVSFGCFLVFYWCFFLIEL